MKTLLILFVIILFLGCVGGGKYYRPYDEFEPEEIAKEGNYIYKDDELILASRIRNAGIMGTFAYDVIIWNIGSVPIQLNWVYDNLFLTYKGKKYICDKMTNIKYYPDVLNPDSYTVFMFGAGSQFNDVINEIEELYFILSHNDTTYTLIKNPKVKWE
jgi:hypothetical protein